MEGIENFKGGFGWCFYPSIFVLNFIPFCLKHVLKLAAQTKQLDSVDNQRTLHHLQNLFLNWSVTSAKTLKCVGKLDSEIDFIVGKMDVMYVS